MADTNHTSNANNNNSDAPTVNSESERNPNPDPIDEREAKKLQAQFGNAKEQAAKYVVCIPPSIPSWNSDHFSLNSFLHCRFFV